MSIQIDSTNRIFLDGKETGLAIVQRREGTTIYTPESRSTAQRYQEHWMPFARYSTAHDQPHKPGQLYDPEVCAGRAQLESDVRLLLSALADEAARPTDDELRAYAILRGWFSRFDGATWVACYSSQDPGAMPDLNRAADHFDKKRV